MPENTQRVSVGGFSFENKDEAEQDEKGDRGDQIYQDQDRYE